MAKELLNALDKKSLSSERFFNQMNRLMGASIGVIAVRTREFARAQELIHQWASLMDLELRVWCCNTGYKDYNKLPVTDDSEGGDSKEIEVSDDMMGYLKPKSIDGATLQLDQAFEFFQSRGERAGEVRDKFCGVLVGLNKELLDSMLVQQYIRDHTQRAYQMDDRIILLLDPGATIPDPIKTDVEIIDLSPPTFAELQDTLNEYDDKFRDDLGVTFKMKDKEFIIQNAIGMTGQEFENSVSFAMVDMLDHKKQEPEYEVTAKDFVNVIKRRKLEVLKSTEVLELMSELDMSMIGGLDELKHFLEIKATTFSPEARKFGILPPKGILLVGPPGTAKSAIGRAVGSTLGIPTIGFSIANVLHGIVGSSEARLRMVFKMLEEMAPNVVFMDEIDKMFQASGGDGDSGVSRRILGMTLTWMQEKANRGVPCFIVASANDVSNLPPELVRKGRFDETFSVTFPQLNERADIFKIHVEKRGHELDQETYDFLASVSDNYVGGEIEQAVIEALEIDFFAKRKTIQASTIQSCVERMIPQAKAYPKRIKAMRDWCEQNARPSSTGGSFAVSGEGLENKAVAKPTGGRRPVRKLGAIRRSTGD